MAKPWQDQYAWALLVGHVGGTAAGDVEGATDRFHAYVADVEALGATAARKKWRGETQDVVDPRE